MTIVASHVLAGLHLVDAAAAAARSPSPPGTPVGAAAVSRAERMKAEGVDNQEKEMKKIAVRILRLKARLFKKLDQSKGSRYPALSIWLGVYGGELPSSLVPIPIRRKRI